MLVENANQAKQLAQHAIDLAKKNSKAAIGAAASPSVSCPVSAPAYRVRFSHIASSLDQPGGVCIDEQRRMEHDERRQSVREIPFQRLVLE